MSVTVEEVHQTVVLVEDTSAGTVVIAEDDGEDLVVEAQIHTVVVEDPAIAVVEVTGGMPGPPGPPGPSGATIEVAGTAGVDLSGHRLVLSGTDGLLVYADPSDPAHIGRRVLLTTGAIMAGDDGSVVGEGEVTEPTWAWTPGAALFLGPNGTLVTAPPVGAAFWVEVGAALGATRIYFDPRTPIRLA